MTQYFGSALFLFGLLLCLCESDSLMFYMACGCLGVVLIDGVDYIDLMQRATLDGTSEMVSGAGIAGAYITKGDKIHE